MPDEFTKYSHIQNGYGDGFWEARRDGYLIASATTESEVRSIVTRDDLENPPEQEN
jgi:hypothetical protein